MFPTGLKRGEVFCYADTIDGNCQAAKNLIMWPLVCASEPLPSMQCAHTSSGRKSTRVLLDRFIVIATGNCCSCGHLENNAIQVSTVILANTFLSCVHNPSDIFFNDRFVALATRNPLIPITSLVTTPAATQCLGMVLATMCEHF